MANTSTGFAAMGAQRILVLGGIALILAGMLFGDIFAVFILHPTNGSIGENLMAATEAVAAKDPDTALTHFGRIGLLLESRGTKVDTHSHIINLGYIALLLALVQPFVALSRRRRRQLALLYIVSSAILPVAVFTIYYVGLAYSPLEDIGWASITADFFGLLLVLACVGELAGLWKYFSGANAANVPDKLFEDWGRTGRTLLAGGILLILAGFLHGAYYAGAHLYEHQQRDVALLTAMVDSAAVNDMEAARGAVMAYGQLGGEKAVQVAAHAHIIEFGLLAMLLAFVQRYVFLSERWKRRWVWVLLVGSVMLPVSVLAELRFGLLAGGFADTGGLMVIVALAGMLVGILRHTGQMDAQKG
jgi:hypothetical protein